MFSKERGMRCIQIALHIWTQHLLHYTDGIHRLRRIKFAFEELKKAGQGTGDVETEKTYIKLCTGQHVKTLDKKNEASCVCVKEEGSGSKMQKYFQVTKRIPFTTTW